jgi:hypothetical protein
MVVVRILAVIVLLIAQAAVLSACGKRGDLIAPDGSTYPQQYPKQ